MRRRQLALSISGFRRSWVVIELMIASLTLNCCSTSCDETERADSPLAQAGDEVLNHAVVYIGFQQRQPHRAHGGVNIGGGEFTPTPQRIKDLVQPSGECLEQGVPACLERPPDFSVETSIGQGKEEGLHY